MRKCIALFMTVVLIITFVSCMKDESSNKRDIFAYVDGHKQDILDTIAELERLCENTELEDGEYIDGIGNSEFNSYADVNGLYLDIEKPGSVGRELEIENDILDKILNGKPVEDIAIDGDVIIFYCGGYGIVPSSQDYYFYYSPGDEPVAVFDTEVVCTTSQMSPEGDGYVYYDEDSNGFYTEKITDNFYYCKAEF